MNTIRIQTFVKEVRMFLRLGQNGNWTGKEDVVHHMNDAIACGNVQSSNFGPRTKDIAVAHLEFPSIVAHGGRKVRVEKSFGSHQHVEFEIALQFVVIIDLVGCVVQKNTRKFSEGLFLECFDLVAGETLKCLVGWGK